MISAVSRASALTGGPLPVQVCTWLPERSGYEGGIHEVDAGEWLYCLKGTEPGDRQVVWSGVHGKGIIAVVDFSGEVRRRSSSGRLYEGWGLVSPLPRPVSVARVQSNHLLARFFAQPIQGVKTIDEDVARAIAEVAGGLPKAPSFDGEADWDEGGGNWSGERLPPEKITEDLVLNEHRVAGKLGLPPPVNPNGTKVRLPNGKIPDLWCESGVVGDVKNQVTARWGPEQLEGYIEQCDLEWPAHQWRGLLVQGEPEMAPNALPRLQQSRYRERIEVWLVSKRRRGPGHHVKRLFPE